MKKACLAAFLFFIVINTYSQNYSILFMPDSLREHANAIKRDEELRIIIKDPGKAVIKHTYAVTILNEAGRKFSIYQNEYDKLIDLSDIDGNLYDAMGKKLKNVKKKDIGDYSADDQMSLVTDTRFKQHVFYSTEYPYTVQYEDVQELNGVFFLPGWIPQETVNYAVQGSRLIVETPSGYKLNYKQFNYQGNPVITNSGDKTVYTWEVKNLRALAPETSTPAWYKVTASVLLTPVNFEIEGYKGSMDTWQNFGKFIYSLNAGRDVLPDNIKQDVHRITDGISDKKQKAIALYEYLQKNTRYISIQIGVGSWQPFDANYVASKKYGDCKALSNFMKALLKEAGIASNYVLIRADDDDNTGLFPDFPAPYFNHAILCMPNGKDTLWFECTSQTKSPGYMGSFTGNRKALLIADDGGHVVNTPSYTSSDNQQIRKTSAVLDEKGNITASVHTKYTGVEQELPHAIINEINEEQRKEYLNNIIDLPTYQVTGKQYSEQKGLIPVVNEELDISVMSYASISGKRLFIKPNLITKQAHKFSDDDKRKSDIEYPYSFQDIDTVQITIPSGFSGEAIPKDVDIKTKFGEYSIKFVMGTNSISVYRKYERNAGYFPASDYPEYAKFHNDMYKADRSQVVLVKASAN